MYYSSCDVIQRQVEIAVAGRSAAAAATTTTTATRGRQGAPVCVF